MSCLFPREPPGERGSGEGEGKDMRGERRARSSERESMGMSVEVGFGPALRRVLSWDGKKRRGER